MYEIKPSNRFKRDIKLAKKRGYKIDLVVDVIQKLANGEALAENYRDHSLEGQYADFRECHITPDWILIYQILEDELILFLSRTWTHSDLF